MNIDVPLRQLKVHRRELAVPRRPLTVTYVVDVLFHVCPPRAHITVASYHAMGPMHRSWIKITVGTWLQHFTLSLTHLTSSVELSQLFFTQSRHLLDIGSGSTESLWHNDL
jgi:hypothetical protein